MAEKTGMEKVFSMALVSGVTMFSLYLVYRFFQSKGWIASKGEVATAVMAETFPMIEAREYKIF